MTRWWLLFLVASSLAASTVTNGFVPTLKTRRQQSTTTRPRYFVVLSETNQPQASQQRQRRQGNSAFSVPFVRRVNVTTAARSLLSSSSTATTTTANTTSLSSLSTTERQDKEMYDKAPPVWNGTTSPTSSTSTASASTSPAQEQNLTLGQLLPAFLHSDQLMYGFSAMRRLVKQHDARMQQYYPAESNATPVIPFDAPQLILTRHALNASRTARFLQYDVRGADIAEFITRNRRWFTESADGVLQLDPTGRGDTTVTKPLSLEKELQQAMDLQLDAWVTEFDDSADRRDLCFGILVDATQKRVIILFRGTVFEGQDLLHDLDFSYTQMPMPKGLRNHSAHFAKHEYVSLHNGFYSYLHRGPLGKPSNKFYRIVETLYEVMQEHAGYDIFISGHSLGGALSQLFAFKFVAYVMRIGAEDLFRSWPLHIVSFASPHVGNAVYANAFHTMEDMGYIRHLRFTNEGDVIPVGMLNVDYHQTGVNIHLKANNQPAEVAYRQKERNFWQQLRPTSARDHAMATYHERFHQDVNSALQNATIDKLYEEYYNRQPTHQ